MLRHALTPALVPVALQRPVRAKPAALGGHLRKDRSMRFDDLITQVTNDLVTAIEAGAADWEMPWHTIATTAQPRSIDHRPYRGLNALVLALHGAERGWTSGTWATYLGWQRHGAQVRRGERATHVVLWKPVNRSDNTDNEPTSDDTPATRGRLVSRVFAEIGRAHV